MFRSLILGLAVGLVALAAHQPAAAQKDTKSKAVAIDDADLAKLADKSTPEADKKEIHAKYNDKAVRLTCRAKGKVASSFGGQGEGFIVAADGKSKAELMVYFEKPAEVKQVETVLNAGKADALIVVEGTGMFPNPKPGLSGLTKAKLVSLKQVPKAK